MSNDKEDDVVEIESVGEELRRELEDVKNEKPTATASTAVTSSGVATLIPSSQERLRNTLFRFFEDTIQKVNEEQTLMSALRDSFLEDVNNGVLDFAERESLYQLMASKQNNQVNNLLSLFKPVPGTPSMLADDVLPEKKEDSFQTLFERSSPQDLQKLSKLVDILQLSASEDDRSKEGSNGSSDS